MFGRFCCGSLGMRSFSRENKGLRGRGNKGERVSSILISHFCVYSNLVCN